MKNKKALIWILAALMTGGMAFTACDAQGFFNSVMEGLQTSSSENTSDLESAETESVESSENAENSSEIVESGASDESVASSETESVESVEESTESVEGVESVESVESPESSEETSEETSEEESGSEGDKNYLDDETLAIFQAAIEKSIALEKNFTVHQVVDMEEKSWDDAQLMQHYQESWDQIEKREGIRLETSRDERLYDIIEGKSETRFWHDIYEFTNEEETEAILYSYDNGKWIKGYTNIGSDSESAVSEAVKIYQQMVQHLQYNRETGIYYIEDLTVDLTDIMGDLEGLENGYATGIYHRIEIELKDGYLYRLYTDMTQYLKTKIKNENEEIVYEWNIDSKVTEYFSHWGTTVVTLPEIAE